MNTIIELHDSVVAEVATQGSAVDVHFRPAYIHKSEGRPGFDAGTGWVQDAVLIFQEAVAAGEAPDLPCEILTGELTVGGQRHDNHIPVPLVAEADTELRLVFDSMHTVKVRGGSVRLMWFGEPRCVGEFCRPQARGATSV
jgi:hypothetical protein